MRGYQDETGGKLTLELGVGKVGNTNWTSIVVMRMIRACRLCVKRNIFLDWMTKLRELYVDVVWIME